MKFKLLTFVFIAIFSQMLFAEDSEMNHCENPAGECKYGEGSNTLQCICADQEKNGAYNTEVDPADEESCKAGLEEMCGTTVPAASEVCETSENLENCEAYIFAVGNCFEHDYTQEDVDEFHDGGWNKYSRYVTSCCYSMSREEMDTAHLVDTKDCIDEQGCTEECIQMENTDPVSDDEESNTEESESSDSDGCSVLMI